MTAENDLPLMEKPGSEPIRLDSASSANGHDTNPPAAPEAEQSLPERLAAMGELDYQQQRAALAAEAGIGVGALDLVRKESRKAQAQAAATPEAGEPWPNPVDGADLAAGVEAALRRFVVLDPSSYVLATVWAIATHSFEARAIFPMILARSPQPACGKSTLLDTLERMVANAFMAGNASLATLFRSAANGPTQLLDELDRWLDRDPEVSGYLCAGWQSGRPFLRCDPETLELREFVCFCPKALALIGDVADEAIRSRCIIVDMRRALPGERPERFRAGRIYPELAKLRAQAARWATDHYDEIASYELEDRDLPELSGRAADNAEALLAVAEAIGAGWVERVRQALTESRVEESQDLAAMLLVDIRTLIDEMPAAQAIATDRILDHLHGLEDRPWPTAGRGGKPITPHWLQRKLAPFGARPDRHYIRGVRARGYSTEPLREAIARYITPPPAPPEQASQVSPPSHSSASGGSEAHESTGRDTWDRWDAYSDGSGEGAVRGDS